MSDEVYCNYVSSPNLFVQRSSEFKDFMGVTRTQAHTHTHTQRDRNVDTLE